MDVFNITISRQQAEVEVIPHYLSIGKNKSRFHIDLTDAVVLVLGCNILFPKRGSNLLLCGIRKIGLMFCPIHLN